MFAADVTWGESEETLSPGTKLSVSPGDDRLKEGRMTITLEDPQKEIRILSTKRAQGTPSYFGTHHPNHTRKAILIYRRRRKIQSIPSGTETRTQRSLLQPH